MKPFPLSRALYLALCLPLFACPEPPPEAVCGDGVIADGEACDDQNPDAGDGCDAACAIEAGFSCEGEPSFCDLDPVCGNGEGFGTEETGEECDFGDTNNGDGCDENCQFEECDGGGDCTACQTCAQGGVCAEALFFCETNPECLPLNDCLNACAPGDQACQQACATQFINGVDDLRALAECAVCDACFADCDGAGQGCQ